MRRLADEMRALRIAIASLGLVLNEVVGLLRELLEGEEEPALEIRVGPVSEQP